MRLVAVALAWALVACGGGSFSSPQVGAHEPGPEAGDPAVDASPSPDAAPESSTPANELDAGQGGGDDAATEAAPEAGPAPTVADLVACSLPGISGFGSASPASWEACNSMPVRAPNAAQVVYGANCDPAQPANTCTTCKPQDATPSNCSAGTPCFVDGNAGTCLACVWAADSLLPANVPTSCPVATSPVVCNAAPPASAGCTILGNGPFWCCSDNSTWLPPTVQ